MSKLSCFIRFVIAAALMLSCNGIAGDKNDGEGAELLKGFVHPPVNFQPGENYGANVRKYQGIPSIERSPGGRLWAVWYAGKIWEDRYNYVVAATSGDDGKTWSDLKLAIDPDGDGPRRNSDPCLWLDPSGRLWLFWWLDGGGLTTTMAITAENPDSENPVWTEPQALFHGVMLNKPVVLKNGDWLMPAAIWGRDDSSKVMISRDRGKSFSLLGTANIPQARRNCDEHMIVERKDGTLMMLVRTAEYGIGRSLSTDGGRTWTAVADYLPDATSRFHFRRLSSGNLLLVKHGPLDKRIGRSHLTAYLSEDGGESWKGGLLVDERNSVSYPDGIQATDGSIYIIYDWQRGRDKHILMSQFTEEDVLAGKDVSGKMRQQVLINRATGVNPKIAGSQVMARLVNVTAPEVMGAHDAEIVMVGDRAYIVAEVNDVQAGESAGWPEIYASMSIVNLKTLAVEKIIPFARSGQVYENETLPVGACFVPRIIQKDVRTLRCYFASEQPGKREAQTWFIDFDLASGAFENRIHKAKLKTSAGVFDMQPKYFHADAVDHGFAKPAKDFGLYLFDSFKQFDSKTYVAINNFPGQQNALAMVHDDLATFEVIGHYNEPQSVQLSESSVNRLPDGTWMAICRQDGGNGNYYFTTSKDGRTWTVGRELPFLPNGTNSKPTFDKFGDTYYLGWQESTKIEGIGRSVFNIHVSRDCAAWDLKYRFETKKSFQYPTFREHKGTIWLCVTQGSVSPSRKERIMFGKLE
ncbi:MAG: hypothetical protein A2283_12145 [Lentisphaerae bacterium RIFOXYA12_FULL_48_11]|nr:MAG: hypothetical protein A2283_12145 [Lentisphaerae bacterium RIFOXYA12_FULL_48_11]